MWFNSYLGACVLQLLRFETLLAYVSRVTIALRRTFNLLRDNRDEISKSSVILFR